jgi:hypothetical protein
MRTKLWALRLHAKDDVNKHVNDFTLYMDQLKELGREEREETLTDLFLDSILDPKFEVTIANCGLRERISIHECFEAIRKYHNMIAREATQGEGNRYKIRRVNNGIKQETRQQGKAKIDGSYRTYNEWQKLTPEERAAVLAAREKKAKIKVRRTRWSRRMREKKVIDPQQTKAGEGNSANVPEGKPIQLTQPIKKMRKVTMKRKDPSD